LGLATAFVLSLLWPELLKRQTVEVREIGEVALPATVERPTAGTVSYSQAVEKAAPAVVNVHTAKLVTVRTNPFFDDPFFRQFFGGDDAGGSRQRVETSLGSGVIFSEQGYILTNHHVIRGADAIQVSLRDGRTAAAKVVGSDPDSDLAVLKVDLQKLPAMTLGASDKLRVGDVVLAIGNPFGVGQTVTMGIVSATGRNRVGINMFENFIQTDAAINPGNSGGALVDAHGNLIGINTAIYSKTGGSLGIGFAIPVTHAKTTFEDIVEHGRPLRGWLGLEGRAVTAELARELRLADTRGVVITNVLRDAPAQRAGIARGDVVLAVDGKKITEPHDVLKAISLHRPGSKVKLKVWRDGKELNVEATAIERPQRLRTTG
jgi:Do/DeqQ family serine protease